MAFVNTDWNDGLDDDFPLGISTTMAEDIRDAREGTKQMTVPKTNRDVINAMSDEELAKWKHSYPAEIKDKNGYCRIYWQNPQRCRPELHCMECLIEWLKAPAGKHQEVEG